MTHQLFSAIRKIFYSHSQKGAILVLFAITFPFLMAFSAIAVDLGTVYVQRVHLQNAADAAALAGAWQLGNSSDDPAVNSAVSYTAKNSPSDITVTSSDSTMPSAEKQINLSSDINRKSSYSTIEVQLRERVPLYFFHYFGMESMPIAVTATAKYTAGSLGSSTYNPFSNAIYTSGGMINFNSENVFVDGNISTDTQVKVPGTYSTDSLSGTITGINSYETHPYAVQNGAIWSQYDSSWNSQTNSSDIAYHQLKQSSDGKTLTSFSDANYIQTNEDFYSKSNDTAQTIVNEYIKSTVSSVGTTDIDSTNHIYYNPTIGSSFNGQVWTTDGYTGLMNSNSGWNPSNLYTQIIVDGSINAGMYNNSSGNSNTPPSQVILVSLNGDVIFNNSFTSEVNVIIYAPNGNVLLEGSNNTYFKGSIVAKSVTVTNQGTIKYSSSSAFGGSFSNSAITPSVILIR